MPYPNEHACRIRQPSEFRPDTFRRVTSGRVDLIMGKLKSGGDTMVLQAIRFPKDKWSEDTARKSCSDRGGTFDPAGEMIETKITIDFNPEKMHSDFQRILRTFVKHYGEQEGPLRFSLFVLSNDLNPAKQYHPTVQFSEAYEWTKPLIQYYKQDDEAKYWLITAITANISMNNKDYSDWDKLSLAGNSLNWRPVNMNHDHSKWLPFPRTRIDFSQANEDEMAVEATLRVDNQDKWLQDLLEANKIAHPSIEGRPTPDGNYHFMGVALLEKGVKLPGDPLSEIVPLFLNESVRSQICHIKDGKLVCDCESKVNLETEQKEDTGDLSEKKENLALANELATLKLENFKMDEQNKKLKKETEAQALIHEGYRLEAEKRLQDLIKENSELKGAEKEKDKQITRLEANAKIDAESFMEAKAKIKEAYESRDNYKDIAEKNQTANKELIEKHARVFAENTQLTIDLTKEREDHLESRKRIGTLEEKLSKGEETLKEALHTQKSLYEKLKELGFVIVSEKKSEG